MPRDDLNREILSDCSILTVGTSHHVHRLRHFQRIWAHTPGIRIGDNLGWLAHLKRADHIQYTAKPVLKTTWEIGTWELRTATSVPMPIQYIEMDLRNKTTSEFRAVFCQSHGCPEFLGFNVFDSTNSDRYAPLPSSLSVEVKGNQKGFFVSSKIYFNTSRSRHNHHMKTTTNWLNDLHYFPPEEYWGCVLFFLSNHHSSYPLRRDSNQKHHRGPW